MTLKYQAEMQQLGIENCPPPEYDYSPRTAFRFIFKDLDHPNNFKPVALIFPQRLNEFRDYAQKCQTFGLSMFAENEKAKRHFMLLQKKTAGRFSKTVGTCLAALKLGDTDGLHSDPFERSDSHITFHEFKDTDLAQCIINVENL
jgi:hypothetical protein